MQNLKTLVHLTLVSLQDFCWSSSRNLTEPHSQSFAPAPFVTFCLGMQQAHGIKLRFELTTTESQDKIPYKGCNYKILSSDMPLSLNMFRVSNVRRQPFQRVSPNLLSDLDNKTLFMRSETSGHFPLVLDLQSLSASQLMLGLSEQLPRHLQERIAFLKDP